MCPIKVCRTVHVPWPDPAEEARVVEIAYVSGQKNILLENIKIGTHWAVRRSEDNGRTWQEVEEWEKWRPLGDNLRLERRPPFYFCDPGNGLSLRIFITRQDTPGVVNWSPENPAIGTTRLYTQISSDDGRTWFPPEQVILHGDDYDKTHWMDAVWYGKNSISVEGGHIIKGRDDSILVPYWGPKLFGNDTIQEPGTGRTWYRSGCLRGRWRDDGSGLDWEHGQSVTLPQKHSSGGSDEISFEYLPDNRLLAVLRASVGEDTGQEVPSLHYFTVSDDDGRTWCEPFPVLYEDGSYVHSPACLANVAYSSKNGRYYLITNINKTPCYNCDPRTVLQIAEINIETMRLRRETVTVIEEQNREAGEPDNIRFSNFRWYEDRETKDIVLYMTACPGNVGRSPTCGCSPSVYRYDITLPMA